MFGTNYINLLVIQQNIKVYFSHFSKITFITILFIFLILFSPVSIIIVSVEINRENHTRFGDRKCMLSDTIPCVCIDLCFFLVNTMNIFANVSTDGQLC